VVLIALAPVVSVSKPSLPLQLIYVNIRHCPQAAGEPLCLRGWNCTGRIERLTFRAGFQFTDNRIRSARCPEHSIAPPGALEATGFELRLNAGHRRKSNCAMKKPFDELAKRLEIQLSRGDRI
jgi:hypothetical protein